MRSRLFAVVGSLVFAAASSVPAHASYIVSLEEVGSDVIATGSGSLDLSALTFQNFASVSARIRGDRAYLVLGLVFTGVEVYRGIVGPSSFGPGSTEIPAFIGTGTTVAIEGAAPGLIGVPVGYVWGTALGTTTITWENASLATLGVTSGTYVWTWGSGANADSYTLRIGPSGSVPEPAALGLLGVGLVGVGLRRGRPTERHR